ncbi:MAG: VWA domain-containing protein [Candidatus Gastranaerophilales bacterium]|nr:VWA domain-containing protein [Candidatus Gastranaerophilales bacterium]
MLKSFKKFIIVSVFFGSVLLFSGFENYKVVPHNNLSEVINDDRYEKILFIVDLSNSMNETINGIKKTDIAFNAFAAIISRLNPKVMTGLRVYGHKYGFNPLLACTATELASPIKENNAYNIYSILSKMEATGWTPITRSLKSAVNSDFAGIEGQKRIILLTDGGENCDESPCDYAIKLVQSRDDIRIDVIEFAIDDPIADAQLKCTALTTSGKLYKANDADSLAKSLERILEVETQVEGKIISK